MGYGVIISNLSIHAYGNSVTQEHLTGHFQKYLKEGDRNFEVENEKGQC